MYLPPYPPEFDQPEICEICRRDAGVCECPECPVCGEIGRAKCMDEHGLIVPGITKADIEARDEARDEGIDYSDLPF